MNLPNEDQWDEAICSSAVCQHPQCWASFRRIERGHPRILDSSSKPPREIEDKLPTLTIVNITDTCLWTKKTVVQQQPSQFTLPKEQSLFSKAGSRRHSKSQKALHDKYIASCSRPPKLSVLNLNEANLPFSEDLRNMVVTWVPEETEKNMSSVGKMSTFSSCPGKKKRKKQGEKTRSSLYFSGSQYASTRSRSPGVIVPPPSPVHFFNQLNSEAIPLWAQVDMLPRDLLKECMLAHEKSITCPEVKIELAKMTKNLPPEKIRPDSALSSKMFLTIHRVTLQRPSLRYPEHLRKLQYNLKRSERSSGPGSSGNRKQQRQHQRKVTISPKKQFQEAKKQAKSDVEGQHVIYQRLPSEQECEKIQEEQEEEEEEKAFVKHYPQRPQEVIKSPAAGIEIVVSMEESSEYDFDSYYTDYSFVTDNDWKSLDKGPAIYEPTYKDISDVDETTLGMMTSSGNSSPSSMSASLDKTGWNPELNLLRILQASVEEDENHPSRTQSETSLDT